MVGALVQAIEDFFAVQSDIASQLGNRLGEAGVIDRAEQEAGAALAPR